MSLNNVSRDGIIDDPVIIRGLSDIVNPTLPRGISTISLLPAPCKISPPYQLSEPLVVKARP